MEPSPINVKDFKRSSTGTFNLPIVDGSWPENLKGHVVLIGPFHRDDDMHLFAGEGLVIRWDLQPQGNTIRVQSKKLETWDGFWHSVLPLYNLTQAFFPASISPLGIAELANTAVVNMEGRLILTADAGRYWEVDPVTLDTITPIGYFDEHIISVPLSFYPMVTNTAHPVYDPITKELITCELKPTPRLGYLFTDMVSTIYITKWDGSGTLQHWKLAGSTLDGSPHTTLVTDEWIMIPDMPFQVGLTILLGLKSPTLKPYPKTQLYVVNRADLKVDQETVPARLVTFEGDSYHFLWDYYPINYQRRIIAVQQATLSLTQAIEPTDVRWLDGSSYSSDYYGLPWMFAFDPGVMSQVVVDTEYQVVSQHNFMHPGWFSTTLFTADPNEFMDPKGYSAIYQVYAGYYRDFICRRHYLNFRDHPNRQLTDEQLPPHDLPSVLAKLPLDQNWSELTQAIQSEQEAHPETPVVELGRDLLDFYVFPLNSILDSIQFIPEATGYILTTVLTPHHLEAWLFAADNLKQGPIAKIQCPGDVHFGFTLHSEYFATVQSSSGDYQVNQFLSDLRSVTRVPYEFFVGEPDDIVNRSLI